VDDYVDIAEVSTRLGGFAPKHLARACEEGEIPARNVGGEWLIQRKWLAELEARIKATVATAVACAAIARPAKEPVVQLLEDRRLRKATNHFLNEIGSQLAELKAELARIDERLVGLDKRTLHIAQRLIRSRDEAQPAAGPATPVLQITPINGDSSRLD
jgi:hypothetical protein